MADETQEQAGEARASRPPVDGEAPLPPPPPPPPVGGGFGPPGGFAAGGPTPPPPPPGGGGGIYPPPPPQFREKRRGGGVFSRVLAAVLAMLLAGSLLLNLYLGAIFALLAPGPHESEYLPGDASQRIVIVPVEGLIDDGTAEFVRQALLHLRANVPKAVILRVDSGGGMVTPSDQIWDDVTRFKRDTGVPVVASFGSTAASGGYYVAAGADAIVAEPTCITGSIGVIAQAFTFQELLGKVGVTPEVVVASGSDEKDMLNPMRAWTEEDREKLQGILDHAYARFVEVVHQGRSAQLSRVEVEAVATGEVYTVDEAIALKLVDQKGYLLDAVEVAKARASIASGDQPRVTRMTRPEAFGLGLLGVRSPGMADLSGVSGEQLRRWLLELSVPKVLYLGVG